MSKEAAPARGSDAGSGRTGTSSGTGTPSGSDADAGDGTDANEGADANDGADANEGDDAGARVPAGTLSTGAAGPAEDGEQSAHALAAVHELKDAWLRRCEAAGCAVGPEDDEERLRLLSAIEAAATSDAVARSLDSSAASQGQSPAPRPASTIAARRKALDTAADRWGARVALPALAVEQLLLLRHLTTSGSDGERLGRLVDRAMLVATRSATDELQLAAFTDPLTGCSNRRAFERDIERELARCVRAELDLCIIAIDVDRLKAVNDAEGHAAGDRVLLQLVETIRRALRSLDSVYRFGGDEFLLLLPDTSTEDAVPVMARVERFRPPSFSWGVASYVSAGTSDVAQLLAQADSALYEAKRSGERKVGVPGLQPPDLPDVPDSERRPISRIGPADS